MNQFEINLLGRYLANIEACKANITLKVIQRHLYLKYTDYEVNERTYRNVLEERMYAAASSEASNILKFTTYLISTLDNHEIDDALTIIHKEYLNVIDCKHDFSKKQSVTAKEICEEIIDIHIYFRTIFGQDFVLQLLRYYILFLEEEKFKALVIEHLNEFLYSYEKVACLYSIQYQISEIGKNKFSLYKNSIPHYITGITKNDEEILLVNRDLTLYEEFIHEQINFYSNKVIINSDPDKVRAFWMSLIDELEEFDIIDIPAFVNAEFHILKSEDYQKKDPTYVIKFGRKKDASKIISQLGVLESLDIIKISRKKLKQWIYKVFGNYQGFTEDNIHSYLMRKNKTEPALKQYESKLRAIFEQPKYTER